jgi:hypothetical protein
VDVPWIEGSGFGFVAHHFDVVPVRTNDESRIVVRVVMRAQTRRAIVCATRLQAGRREVSTTIGSGPMPRRAQQIK